MPILTEILLKSTSLPLVDIADSLPSNQIKLRHTVHLKNQRQMFMISIGSDSKVAFENAVSNHEEIVDTTEIGQTADCWFYQLTIDVDTSLSTVLDPRRFDCALMEPSTITASGWEEHKVLRDYETLREFRDCCIDHDIYPELMSISSTPGLFENGIEFGLTKRQREALILAFASGYYDSPRTTSTKDLSDQLEISAASTSNLLRRAEHQLISQALGQPTT